MFELNTNSEEILYGLGYMGISGVQIPLYFFVMLAVYLKDKQEQNMTFKLINMIHLWQAGQVCAHFITSPILIFPQLQTALEMPIRVLGCLLTMFYNCELPSMALLAICRILIFSKVIPSEKMHIGIKLVIFFGMCIMLTIFCYSVITGAFIFSSPAWRYDLNIPLAGAIQSWMMTASIVYLAIAYTAYLVISYMIYTKGKGALSSRSKKNEICIMIQYTIIVFYTTLTLIVWHKAAMWFDLSSPRVQALINMSLIAGTVMNPVLILIFNLSIRQECAAIAGLRSRDKPVALFGSSH